MFCAGVKRARGLRGGRRAFTLLEVMCAVWIIALVAIGMFRFVNVNLQAIRVSTERGARDESIRGLTALVQRQLNDLAPLIQGALLGGAHTFQDVPSDELSWKCEAGNGLLTVNATGEYDVTLTVRRDSQARKSWLSLRRVEDNDAKETKPDWIDLMDHVDGIEFRYFDPRRNSWLDRWTDNATRPALVRMRLWQEKNPVPYEAVLTVPQAHPPSG